MLLGAYIVYFNVNFKILKQINCALVGLIKDWITPECTAELWKLSYSCTFILRRFSPNISISGVAVIFHISSIQFTQVQFAWTLSLSETTSKSRVESSPCFNFIFFHQKVIFVMYYVVMLSIFFTEFYMPS